MKYNTDTPEHILNEYVKSNHERWDQLNGLLLSVISDGVKYLFAVNAGGCIAMLALLGASEELRKQEWTWTVLFVLFLGLVSVGILNFARYHVIDYLLRKWNQDVVRFYEGEMDFDELSRNDDRRVVKSNLILIFAYFAFACFVYAGYVGATNYKSSLNNLKNGDSMNTNVNSEYDQKNHVPRPAPVAPPVQPPK